MGQCLWVSDFTYVATWTGFVYVAFVIEPIGNIPPAEAEERYYATLEEPPMAA